MTISLDCAITGRPGNASTAATAADSKNFFIHSSLGRYLC
jgi:hypothetical protein